MTQAATVPDAVHKISEQPSAAQTDKALITKPATPVGGIDFNPNTIDLKTKGQAAEFDIPPGFENLETIPLEGLSPEIFQIAPVPAHYLSDLLGMSDEEKPPRAKSST